MTLTTMHILQSATFCVFNCFIDIGKKKCTQTNWTCTFLISKSFIRFVFTTVHSNIPILRFWYVIITQLIIIASTSSHKISIIVMPKKMSYLAFLKIRDVLEK